MRYGMQLVMPKAYNMLTYYGKGPGENYIDRNNGDRLGVYDAKVAEAAPAARAALREEANTAIAAMLQEKAADTLDKVLFELSSQIKNAYSRSDA